MIILSMSLAKEGRRYDVTSFLLHWANQYPWDGVSVYGVCNLRGKTNQNTLFENVYNPSKMVTIPKNTYDYKITKTRMH